MKKLLTIAGTDPSGGAGIQADLKTFAAHKVYGMSVITSVVSQNTMGVRNIIDLPPEFIEDQLDAVFTDIYPDAIKIGMVSNEKTIKVIASKLNEYEAKNIVIDPVMVATSGNSLMKSTASHALIRELLPLADIITPNMEEATILSGINVENKNDMEKAAKIINGLVKGDILIKGGHLSDSADDLLYIGNEFHWIEGKKIDNPNTHGTGCTLSSAIAVNLAKGMDVLNSFREAKKYITGAINAKLDIGKGRGPLDHLYALPPYII